MMTNPTSQVEINIPFNFTPRPYQLEFLSSPKRFKIAVIHRRGGKSKTALNDQIIKSQITKGIYYYFLPTYRQAKAVMWDELVKKHVPMELVHKINDSELAIYWKNGSIQRFAGCEDIDKHRGINPIDVVFDEYSEMDERIWTAIIQPVLRENGGSATFIFTPKGRNHSHRLLLQAKDDPDNWFTTIKSVYDTQGLSAKEIEDAKKSTPEALFRQEYLCEFLEGAGAFFRRIRDNVYRQLPAHNPNFTYQLGVDLAKYNDWTVITPLNLNNLYVYPLDRFNQVDWNLQKARITAKYFKYKEPTTVMDATGVGDPIVEDLEADGLDVVPFKFSTNSKRELLTNLSMLLEQDKIKIPPDEGLIQELESISYKLNDKGQLKVVTPQGAHDDRVMSLALACYGITNKLPINNSMAGEYNTSTTVVYTTSEDLTSGI